MRKICMLTLQVIILDNRDQIKAFEDWVQCWSHGPITLLAAEFLALKFTGIGVDNRTITKMKQFDYESYVNHYSFHVFPCQNFADSTNNADPRRQRSSPLIIQLNKPIWIDIDLPDSVHKICSSKSDGRTMWQLDGKFTTNLLLRET